VVVECLANEFDSDLGVLVFEASFGGDGVTINGEGIVVEEFLIEIWCEGSGVDVVFLAQIRPRLQMLVVRRLCHHLHRQ